MNNNNYDLSFKIKLISGIVLLELEYIFAEIT